MKILPPPPLCRGDIDVENPQHEQEARRLFEGMLQALQDVRPRSCEVF